MLNYAINFLKKSITNKKTPKFSIYSRKNKADLFYYDILYLIQVCSNIFSLDLPEYIFIQLIFFTLLISSFVILKNNENE